MKKEEEGMASELQQVAVSADPKTKSTKYKELLDSFISNKMVKELKEFVEHMLEEKTPLVISRPLLQSFAVALTNLPAELHKDVGK